MKYPKRIYYSEADKSLMWDRWLKGDSLNSIARHFGRSHSSSMECLTRIPESFARDRRTWAKVVS